MDFEYSDKVKHFQRELEAFMDAHIYPNERRYEEQLGEGEARWTTIPPIMDELKVKAKEAGLWNLFLPESDYGAGLTNLEYAPLCEATWKCSRATAPRNTRSCGSSRSSRERSARPSA